MTLREFTFRICRIYCIIHEYLMEHGPFDVVLSNREYHTSKFSTQEMRPNTTYGKCIPTKLLKQWFPIGGLRVGVRGLTVA